MNKSLTYIFDPKGAVLLDMSNETFSKENIFEELIDFYSFHNVHLMNCCFDQSDLLGSKFNECFLENCTFVNTPVRKSEFTKCIFKNCQFIECQLTPQANFFETSFMNCRFSSVDFNFAFLSKSKFIDISLTKIAFKGTALIDSKIKNITFNDLEFDKTKPLRINITNSSSFLNLF